MPLCEPVLYHQNRDSVGQNHANYGVEGILDTRARSLEVNNHPDGNLFILALSHKKEMLIIVTRRILIKKTLDKCFIWLDFKVLYAL